MTDREYFSFRYGVPGYTFILLILVFNYVPLIRIIEKSQNGSLGADIASVLLGFVSLFTGAALGFLISQIWYWRFHRTGGLFGIKELAEVKGTLEAKYPCVKSIPKNVDMRHRVHEAVLDYMFVLEEKKRIDTYAGRRWDMYHTLSSTLYTLGIGTVFGIILRFFSEIMIFNTALDIVAIAGNISRASIGEIMSLGFVAFVVVCFGVLLYYTKKRLATEYLPILNAFIRGSVVPEAQIREAFSSYFVELPSSG